MDIEKDAKELLDNAKRQRREARDARPESSSENKKTKEELEKEAKEAEKEKADIEARKKQDMEAQTKHDEEILKKKDEELSADEKKRKAELLEIQKKEDEKKEKSNVQKRIDELTAKIKTLERDRDVTKAEKDALRNELEGLKKELSKTPDDVLKENVKKEISSRISKYIEEDKNLSREDRREMTQEELDEWKAEDFDLATEWITKRSLRRVKEEEEFVKNIRDEAQFKTLLSKQKKSEEILLQKHPELDVTERTKTLEKEGKKPDEIFKILCNEIPKYKLASEILNSNLEKYILSERGPELVAEELDRCLKDTTKESKETSQLEALLKEIADLKVEIQRLQEIDSGLSSTRSPVTSTETKEEKELGSLAEEMGLDKTRILSRMKKRTESGGR